MNVFRVKKAAPYLPYLILAGGMSLFHPGNCKAQTIEDTTTVVTDSVISEEKDLDNEQAEEGMRFRDKSTADSFRVHERGLPEGYSENLKKDRDFWYADTVFRKEEKKSETQPKQRKEYTPLGQRSWVQTLLWILIIGGFAGAIIWYLAESHVGIFRKKGTLGEGFKTGDEMPEDIFAINYGAEIEKAAARGHYRMAVRLMFLRLLKKLSQKEIIQYKQDRTNFDYLMEVHDSPYYSRFFRLTRHFEYSWYGHFEVDHETYRVIAEEFSRFENEIHPS
ncbi:MAG: DUF4129 domain-containing protein [Chitinophagaceae bacterium]